MRIRQCRWLALLLWPALASHGQQWGIDACLTRHIPVAGVAGYLNVLNASGVRVLRERGTGSILGTLRNSGEWRGDVREDYGRLKKEGFKIVAFGQLPFATRKPQAGSQLPEDLLHVYQQGRFLGREFAGLVDVWEMVGEPDIGFCTDLSDRVAAYQKALYLGIKAGAAEAKRKPETGNLKPDGSGNKLGSQPPIVLMGALGLPPGPWLERAAANGLFDYTDAYNFHFYGHAAHLTGVIEAHRAAITALSGRGEVQGTGNSQVSSLRSQVSTTTSSLPLWVTEVGLEAVSKDDFLNHERRQLQADFTISTAKQALAAADVAVFMPFILVHGGDSYAMTLSATKTLPAWDAYAKFTRENSWPQRPLARKQHEVNPVVLQWMPDNQTTVPHKVSGTYRFKGIAPIKGELRVYNLGDTPVQGRIEATRIKNATASLRSETGNRKPEDSISVPAMGMVSIPLEFAANRGGYFLEEWSAAFVENEAKREEQSVKGGTTAGGRHTAGISRQASDVGRRTSVVNFGLEAWAQLSDFTEEPLALRALPDGVIRFPQNEPYVPGEQAGPWTTMNVLRADNRERTTEGGRRRAGDGGRGTDDNSTEFWIERVNTDPLAPTMAVAAVNGLPASGFIRLQLDKPMTKDRKVLVVLVDDRGQRYSIWENFGADYYGSRSDIWLNLVDFHADFWGPMSADYHFKSERIREVHLRFYLTNPNDPVRVGLSLLRAK